MDAPRNLPSEEDAPLEIVRFDAVHDPPAPHPTHAVTVGGFSLEPPAGERVDSGGTAVLGTRGATPADCEPVGRSVALLALDSMAGAGQALAVIEVIQTTPDLSVYLLQRWECAPYGNESERAYLQRSIREGEEFVLGYGDPADGSIAYRLIPFAIEPLRRAA